MVHLRRPAAPAVLRNVGAAVVGLDHDFRVLGIDPDNVVVAVRRRHAGERPAAVGRAVERQLGHVHFVLVFRVDVHLVEIKGARPQRRAAVHEHPAHAGVVRSIQAAPGALGLDLCVDDLRIRLGDVDPHFADQIVGQSARRPRPVVAAVDRLVHAAFARRTAADDRPRLALRAPGAGIQLVRVRPVDRDRHGAGLLVDEQDLLP